jgi:hypothetical protein
VEKPRVSLDLNSNLSDIYSICSCCWNVATYLWKVHNGKIEIISFVVRENEKKLARFFNFMFHYIYHIISQNYSKFGDFVDHIYPIDITDVHQT